MTAPSRGCTFVLSSVTDLHNTRRSFEGAGKEFETFLSYSDHDWVNVAQDHMALNQLHNLIYYYGSEVYGRNEVKAWLKANQDKSVLDHLTASDLAFTVLVYENYHPRWIKEIETAREEEQKRNDTLDVAEKEEEEPAAVGQKRKKKRSSAGPKLKYSKGANVKNKYLQSGWTKEGIRHFKALQESFDKLMKDEKAWQVCKETWDDFISNMKQFSDNCWVPQYFKLDLGDDDEDSIAATDEDKFEFIVADALVGMGTLEVPDMSGV